MTRLLNAIAHRRCHRPAITNDIYTRKKMYLENFEKLYNMRKMIPVHEFKDVRAHLDYLLER